MENEIQEFYSEIDSKITAQIIVDSYSGNSDECDELLKDEVHITKLFVNYQSLITMYVFFIIIKILVLIIIIT